MSRNPTVYQRPTTGPLLPTRIRLSANDRAKIGAIAERLGQATGKRLSMAGVIAYLIQKAAP